MTEVGCWAHARRIFEALTSDLCRATVMLAYIQLLYEIEREARQGNLNPEQRRELRQTKSRPILEDIKNYLQTGKLKGATEKPDRRCYRLHPVQLGGTDALHGRRGTGRIDNNGAERSLRTRSRLVAITGFFMERQRRTNRSRVESLIASRKRLRARAFLVIFGIYSRASAPTTATSMKLLPDKWLVAQRKVSRAHGRKRKVASGVASSRRAQAGYIAAESSYGSKTPTLPLENAGGSAAKSGS